MSEVDKYAGDRAKEKAYSGGADTHWVFFETIDKDLHTYSRYLEFHDKNFSAFSINLVDFTSRSAQKSTFWASSIARVNVTK